MSEKVTIDFDHYAPNYRDDWDKKAEERATRCPVAWSEAHGGYWIIHPARRMIEAPYFSPVALRQLAEVAKRNVEKALDRVIHLGELAVINRIPDYQIDLERLRYYPSFANTAGISSMPATFTHTPRES